MDLRFAPSDITTPVVAIDLDEFAASARAVAARHESVGFKWWPTTAWGGVRSVTRVLQDAGAAGVSVGGLAEAAASVSSGIEAVSVEVPPVVLSQPARFANLGRAASLTAVCDHFAQIERIATACEDAGTESRILLRVDVGLERLGVRPGPDLSDLAEGLANLPGVRLAGIWIGGTTNGTGIGRLKCSELPRLFERCRSSLTRAGEEMSTLSVFSLGHLEGVECRGVSPTATRTPVPAERSAVAVLAGVVARPTRDLAVIDAGREILGSSARVVGPHGATEVAHTDQDFTVLRLASDRQDYVIGDVVALIPELPPRPRSGQSIAVSHDGTWRSERAC